MLCQCQHRCSQSMMWQLSRACCRSLPNRQGKQAVLSNMSTSSQMYPATALNGLLLLASLQHPNDGSALPIPASQMQYSSQETHAIAVKDIVYAIQEHMIGVLTANAIMAWLAMRESGIADMKIPLRYVVHCEGHKLDCAFEVPLIAADTENRHAGLSVAKMATLQVRFSHVNLHDSKFLPAKTC